MKYKDIENIRVVQSVAITRISDIIVALDLAVRNSKPFVHTVIAHEEAVTEVAKWCRVHKLNVRYPSASDNTFIEVTLS